MNADALRKLLAGGEDATLEFKSSARTDAVGRAACGMLNAQGGTLVVGVGDDGRPVGLKNAQDVARELELFLKDRISPRPVLATHVVELGEIECVVVEISKTPDGPYVFEGGVWLRHGVETRAATSSELRALLSAEGEPERWERRISPLMTDDDLDNDEVRSTVREALQEGRFSFSDPDDTRLVLKDLSAVAPGGYTQAGDALFGRYPGRRHPQCRAQFVVFAAAKSDGEYLDNRWFEGPLVRVCTELAGAVNAASPRRSTFEGDDLRRRDQPAYDALAIREGIVNAFVHRDYSAYSGGLRVSMYPDRLEIWNSGSLPVGLTTRDLRREHPSILVNPDIAQVFYLRGLMERLGRGTEFIATASRRIGAAAPTWKDAPTGVVLTMFSAHRTVERQDLNTRQRSLLDALEQGEALPLREYLARFAGSITDRHGRRDLDELVKGGFLVVEGAGPSTVYRRKR